MCIMLSTASTYKAVLPELIFKWNNIFFYFIYGISNTFQHDLFLLITNNYNATLISNEKTYDYYHIPTLVTVFQENSFNYIH